MASSAGPRAQEALDAPPAAISSAELIAIPTIDEPFHPASRLGTWAHGAIR
jgi:hypothetical protein